MKKTYIYLVLILLSFPLFNLNAQDRNVVWVHGLGEDEGLWEHYETIFTQERQMDAHRKSYYTGHGIENASARVISSVNYVLGSDATNSQNIAIGHSMGGLIIRDIDREESGNEMFGGIITVNSPNYGAAIANSIENGSVESVSLDACNKLSAGPLNQALPLPWVILGNLTNDVLCNLLIDLDPVQDLIGYSEALEDLSVSSTKINEINNYSTSTPRISIWSAEDSPSHWHLASSFYSDCENDTELVDDINTARNAYKAYYDYNIGKAIANSWNPFLSALYFNRAAQWKKGYDWIDDSESIWNSLIKTTRLEYYTYSYWDYRCIYVWNEFDDGTKQIAPPPDECEWQWVYVTTTSTVSVSYPSDGLLPEYTQKLEGIPGGNIYKVTGANHMEVTNMSNSSQGDITRTRFDQIWDRQLGDFFRTNKRD
ncbi:MAG: hypothetical protein GQ564_21030 [Bacteroidales bacterium]|nr:hypothetical protein [Bacteroidales bacterium]